MSDRATHYRWDDLPREELNPRIGRRYIAGDQMMIAQVYIAEGGVVPKHEHANEQITYILEGTLRFVLGEDEGETVDVAAGEVLHIPAHVPHSAVALADVLDLDVFHPPRADWLDGSDSYLRQSPPGG